MNNKVFIKIAGVIIGIILVYILFITFFISPKISEYLTSAEAKEARTQLDRVSAIISAKEKALKDLKKVKIDENKKNIKNISKIAYTIMDSNYNLYLNGKLTKKEAISSSFKAISKIKYGFKDDYIYILNREGKLVFHPDKRYQGKNIYYTPDANGKLFIPDLIANTLKNKSTYSRYSWSKLNSPFVSEKISFSVYFKPFDLIISSGVYIENIKQELEVEKSKILHEVSPLINSIVLGNKGYIFLIDSNNKLLLHPNKELIGEDISNLQEPSTGKFLVEEFKLAYSKNRPWNYKWNTPSDKDNYTHDKICWVNYNKFFKWYIVSSIYDEDLQIKSNEINKILLKISILLLVILLVIAMLFIKRLLKPISVMSNTMNLVKEGNLKLRNNITSNDEFGNLSKHFDKMLDSIEENTKNLESKVEERTAEIKYKLYFDKLTGLKNRESLNKDLKDNEFCALNLVDIEGFDNINEFYGFDVGNEILIKVSKLLETFSKQNNVELYRLESDIFIILDSNLERFSSYDTFLQKIQDLFKEEILIDSLEIEVFLYVTVGSSIAQTTPLKNAKIALKKAKQNGVKYLVYNKSIDTKDNIKKMMYWRDKIKTAITEDKVVPFYQPIFNRNEELIKYETLMRIEDEVDNKSYYISPGAFLDIAIKTRQYFKLNQVVIKKAFNDIDKIGVDISINLSFSDIMNIDFIDFIKKEVSLLSKEQREKVVFEILESENISDYEILDEFILKFRQKGIRIAIDDFGTGYSNFSHILEVKPNYIKIDGSLIKDINSDENSYEMVKSIVAFSKSLKMTVIAEFIHSKEVYDIVKELGVDEFQGYFLGEPKPLSKEI